ncbi:MAG TPA: sulfur carrier protein ThiS [Anaerovoracaceae bacterium]|nr:sulfur carrier protein ThiS [Anaerovoracaceae bacterium]
MIITANGKPLEISGEITVRQLLNEANVEMQEYVSVQLNDEIIPRDAFDTTYVKEGAVVEFLYYMGGGEYLC